MTGRRRSRQRAESEASKSIRPILRGPPTSRVNLKLLIVDADTRDEPLDLDVGKYIISRQAGRTTEAQHSLRILEDGFKEYNEIIAQQTNQEAIADEKRHYIAWCNALTRTHFKMGCVQTSIPLAATSSLTQHLSKWRRLGRFLVRVLCCNACSEQYEMSTNDYTTHSSRTKFDKFLVAEGDKDIRQMAPRQAANKARRSQFFNRFAPAYFHKVELPKFMRK